MHFNKPGSKNGLPWTVHFKGVCYIVSAIDCQARMVSEWKPDRKKNPRAFFTAFVSNVEVTNDNIAILKE